MTAQADAICTLTAWNARAQRNDVVVDACMVGGADSAFLQQAAHLTGGLYLRPPRPGGLLQTLLVRPIHMDE